jgi:hypothetical protein
MVLGILQFELLIAEAGSLKDKRRVTRSVKDRLHREHQVSVAEVAAQDRLNVAVMALACVGSDGARIAETLDHVTEKLRTLPDAELGATSRAILHQDAIDASAAHQRESLDEQGLAQELLEYFDRGNNPERPSRRPRRPRRRSRRGPAAPQGPRWGRPSGTGASACSCSARST